MRTQTRLVQALAAGAAATALAATPAVAGPGGDGDGWTVFHQENIAYAAGDPCDFPVTGTVLEDREVYRETYWPDGSVRTQTFRGTLVIEWTNTETGESVVRDQSGMGVFAYADDGTPLSLTAQNGHFSGRLPEGSTPGEGLFYVGGKDTSVSFNPDGTRTLTLGDHGTAEDLCQTLA
jgi:hypothetical protein